MIDHVGGVGAFGLLLLLAVPVGIFALAALFGFLNAAEKDDDGPEIDLDGETGPPE